VDRAAVAKELVKLAKAIAGGSGEAKSYNTMMNVGKAKYVVNYHDGEKTHKDGSPFYDISLFSNKKAFEAFVKELEKEGYREKR
jgi:hypothetical protein